MSLWLNISNIIFDSEAFGYQSVFYKSWHFRHLSSLKLCQKFSISPVALGVSHFISHLELRFLLSLDEFEKYPNTWKILDLSSLLHWLWKNYKCQKKAILRWFALPCFLSISQESFQIFSITMKKSGLNSFH